MRIPVYDLSLSQLGVILLVPLMSTVIPFTQPRIGDPTLLQAEEGEGGEKGECGPILWKKLTKLKCAKCLHDCGALRSHTKLTKHDGCIITRVHKFKCSQKETRFVPMYTRVRCWRRFRMNEECRI